MPDHDREVYVLVVDSRSGDVGYAKAKRSRSGWAFTANPPFAKIVAWIEPDDISLSWDEVSHLPKESISY